MCLSPRSIPVKGAFAHLYPTKWVSVPCGQCLECKKKYQNDWSVRLSLESDSYNNGVFFTLTYNEDTVPYTCNKNTGELFRSVSKKDVQDWFKRFRERYYKHYGKRFTGKYFITSEYGPRTLRPHYHGVIFGIDLYSFKLFALQDWEVHFGFVRARAILTQDKKQRFSAFNYVGKYCTKGKFENPLVAKKYVEPSFKLISKGIGREYIKKHKDYYLATSYLKDDYFSNIDDYFTFLVKFRQSIEVVSSKGKALSYSLPRYFKNKLYENSYFRAKISFALRQMYDDIYNQKLEELQTAWNISSSEANHLLTMQEICLLKRRTEEVEQRFASFLEKSKL